MEEGVVAREVHTSIVRQCTNGIERARQRRVAHVLGATKVRHLIRHDRDAQRPVRAAHDALLVGDALVDPQLVGATR